MGSSIISYKNFKQRNEYNKYRMINTSRALTKTNVKLHRGDTHQEYIGLCREINIHSRQFKMKNDNPLEKRVPPEEN